VGQSPCGQRRWRTFPHCFGPYPVAASRTGGGSWAGPLQFKGIQVNTQIFGQKSSRIYQVYKLKKHKNTRGHTASCKPSSQCLWTVAVAQLLLSSPALKTIAQMSRPQFPKLNRHARPTLERTRQTTAMARRSHAGQRLRSPDVDVALQQENAYVRCPSPRDCSSLASLSECPCDRGCVFLSGPGSAVCRRSSLPKFPFPGNGIITAPACRSQLLQSFGGTKSLRFEVLYIFRKKSVRT
jgi:hypothetical protein